MSGSYLLRNAEQQCGKRLSSRLHAITHWLNLYRFFFLQLCEEISFTNFLNKFVGFCITTELTWISIERISPVKLIGLVGSKIKRDRIHPSLLKGCKLTKFCASLSTLVQSVPYTTIANFLYFLLLIKNTYASSNILSSWQYYQINIIFFIFIDKKAGEIFIKIINLSDLYI